MTLDFDFHNHTKYSRCVHQDYTVAQMLAVMLERGIKTAGFCDHYYPGETNPEAWLADMRAAFQSEPGVRAYAGVEVDMYAPGVLTADEASLVKYDFVAIAAPHWHNLLIRRPLRKTGEALAQAAYDYIIAAAALPYADVVVHPLCFSSASSYIEIDQEAIMREFAAADLEYIADLMHRNDVAIELHKNLLRPEYARSMKAFFEICRDRGVRFSLGSDAHALETVGAVFGAREYIDALEIPDTQRFTPRKHGAA